jgi:H+/Cl- antiporter ClcA
MLLSSVYSAIVSVLILGVVTGLAGSAYSELFSVFSPVKSGVSRAIFLALGAPSYSPKLDSLLYPNSDNGS